MDVVFRLSCAERDSAILDPGTGFVRDTVGVVYSFPDLLGRFGDPMIRTGWGIGGGWVVEDVRNLGAEGVDVAPCEHFLLVERGVR